MDELDQIIEALTRGAKVETDHNEFRAKLAEGRPLRVKYGIDPTSPHVHLGHTVPLNIAKRFQDAGHEIVLIIGDYTARIGDPSGRAERRAPLTHESISENMKGYLELIGKFIDISKTKIRYNSTWFHGMTFADALRFMSQVTVQQILTRKDFSDRMSAVEPVWLHEFLYPLMQGHDSVRVQADVELGGTEQLYTLMCARDLQKREGQEPQTCITVPILRGIDGKKRMGKSIGNYIGVGESPCDIFDKTMSIPDELLPEWFELLADVPSIVVPTLGSEFEQKKRLGVILVTRCHDSSAASAACLEWENRFSHKHDPTVIPEVTIPKPNPDQMNIVDLLLLAGLAASKGEARRLICPNPKTDADGSKSCVTVGPGRWKVPTADHMVVMQDKMVIRVGKRKIVRLCYVAKGS